MTKKKSKPKGIMTTAKVVDIKRHDEGMGVAFDNGHRPQPFIIYFEVADELEIGDLVTLTIVRSEV